MQMKSKETIDGAETVAITVMNTSNSSTDGFVFVTEMMKRLSSPC